MTAITFDTLKFAKRLKEAGFTESQAETQAQALAEALQQSGQGAATKLDIAELKTEIQAMINRLLLTLTGIIVGSMVAMTGVLLAGVLALVLKAFF